MAMESDDDHMNGWSDPESYGGDSGPESYDDDCYGDDDDQIYADDDDDVSCDDLGGSVSDRREAYAVLSEADIRRLQEDEISRLSALFSISRSDSCAILCYYRWNIGKVHDDWFADAEAVRRSVGLLDEPAAGAGLPSGEGEPINCRICFECSTGDAAAASCGHLFCRACWRRYFEVSINDGAGCLTLRCPDPSCTTAISCDMINEFVSDEDKEKYSRCLLRSFIESSRKMKWCPAPGCEFAVSFDTSASSSFGVVCRCGHYFCWNCTVEAHRPVDCEMVGKWMLKNKDESENTNWILANTKPCPKCRKLIQKNQGCMHMTCREPCKYQFCWLCLGSWSEHSQKTGGFYSCNKYNAAKAEGLWDEETDRKQRAKNAIERYTHYYERWAANVSSRKKAAEYLRTLKEEKLDGLRSRLCLLESEVMFAVEAWEQIVECRRVLGWTYAYGYCLPEHEKAKKNLFEYLQGEAESGLERLHSCAEKELDVFFEVGAPSGSSQEPSVDSMKKVEEESPVDYGKVLQQFYKSRENLTGLTMVTRNYFENLMRALENGLEEVQSVQETEEGRRRRRDRNEKAAEGLPEKTEDEEVGMGTLYD